MIGLSYPGLSIYLWTMVGVRKRAGAATATICRQAGPRGAGVGLRTMAVEALQIYPSPLYTWAGHRGWKMGFRLGCQKPLHQPCIWDLWHVKGGCEWGRGGQDEWCHTNLPEDREVGNGYWQKTGLDPPSLYPKRKPSSQLQAELYLTFWVTFCFNLKSVILVFCGTSG